VASRPQLEVPAVVHIVKELFLWESKPQAKRVDSYSESSL
jgi:hypothetical protein